MTKIFERYNDKFSGVKSKKGKKVVQKFFGQNVQ